MPASTGCPTNGVLSDSTGVSDAVHATGATTAEVNMLDTRAITRRHRIHGPLTLELAVKNGNACDRTAATFEDVAVITPVA
jgi:hypothetical protein